MKYRITVPAQLSLFDQIDFRFPEPSEASRKFSSDLKTQLSLYANRPRIRRITRIFEGYDIRRGSHPHHRTLCFDYPIDGDEMVILTFIDARMSYETQDLHLQLGFKAKDTST